MRLLAGLLAAWAVLFLGGFAGSEDPVLLVLGAGCVGGLAAIFYRPRRRYR